MSKPCCWWAGFSDQTSLYQKSLKVIFNSHENALKKLQLVPGYDTLVDLNNRKNTTRNVMRSRQPTDLQKPQNDKDQANDRLAQALRANLHRRKAQARARKAEPATFEGGAITSDEKSPAKWLQM